MTSLQQFKQLKKIELTVPGVKPVIVLSRLEVSSSMDKVQFGPNVTVVVVIVNVSVSVLLHVSKRRKKKNNEPKTNHKK